MNHMMKKILASIAFGLLALVTQAQTLPLFSNDGADNWYYIEFDINSSVITDTGEDQELRNRVAVEGDDGQLWKFVGNENSCTVISKNGRNLYFKKSSNRFFASSSEATTMKIVAASGGKWELQFVDASLVPSANPDAVAIVIYNGSGIDHYLDVWKHNFNACSLNFIKADDKAFTTQNAPVDVPEVEIAGSQTAPAEPLSLWYNTPATNWVKEALPIGNGDMGAMIFGGIAQERVQFNHKTLWKGTSGATDLGSYLAFGDLYIINRNAKAATGYRRELDLAKGVVNVEYASGNTEYRHEYICSNPDSVIVIRYTATGDETLALDLQFINAQGDKAAYTPEGAVFSGTLNNGMSYCAIMAVEAKGGIVSSNSLATKVDGASEVVVYIACGTDFDPSRDNHLAGDVVALEKSLRNAVAVAKTKGFDAVRDNHQADYVSLFGRCDFELHGAVNSVPTNLLLQRSDAASTKMVDMLIFQYGRYLTIASSRGIAVPSNLQGIWNKDGNAQSDAVWASDIHSNVNVQMNYWPVEPTNLSECHLPFLNFMKNEALRENGQWKKNARDLGVDKGWVVNTAGNIFGGSSNYKIGKYSVANAWYCTHLWQHFAYTCDTTFLRDDALPLMKSACEFWFDRLVPAQNGDGSLECPNEYSPEQGFVQNATAHSQQLVAMLFEQTLQAIEVLGNDAALCDDAFVSTLQDNLSRLDKGLRIDDKGMLREWKYQENTPNIGVGENYFADDEHNVWQCHRHTSHLMALYPGFGIDKGIDEDIYDAAIVSLADRGDVATGWARAWRISLWARARDKKRVYNTLRGFAHRTTNLNYDWSGGLYDNMLDAHATSVFQIEGNFGATAGIAEMLLQSRPDSMVLMPALPREWPDGVVKGLKTIGNFEVDVEWRSGRPVTVCVESHSGMPLTIAYPKIAEAAISARSGDAPDVTYNGNNSVSFETVKGGVYLFDFSNLEWEAEAYDFYEPRNIGTKSRNDRNVTKIGLTSPSKGVQEYSLAAGEQSQDYLDLAGVDNPVTFVAEPGEIVEPDIVAGGTWRHHFVYVDYDSGGFSAGIAAGSNWEPTGDLVSYSFYNNDAASDANGWNSVGDEISGGNRSTPQLPAFTVPATDGVYRLRFKQDWSNIDPQGDADGKFGDFKENGGQIIDVLLKVGNPDTCIENMKGKNRKVKTVYDLAGRKLGRIASPGIYIADGKKVLVK
jgi:alpha-L-fucosidase 2